MDDDRYLNLMQNDTIPLTKEELTLGWHFCWAWDGLLVGPGMKEYDEFCTCLKDEYTGWRRVIQNKK